MMPAGDGRFVLSALLARSGVLALVVLPILSEDTVRQFHTVANDLGYLLFENWWKLAQSLGLNSLSWAKFNTVEVIIVATAFAAAWRNNATRSASVVTPEHLLALPFLIAVAAMFVWGLHTGGDLKAALWQTRPYWQMLAIGFLVPQVVRTPPDLRWLTGCIVAAIVIKAAVVCGIFVILAQARFSGWRELVGHEDSIFFVAALCFLFSLLLYERGFRRRAWLVVAGPILLAALILNLRRAGYVALAMNALLLPILLDGRRRLVLGLVVASGAVAGLYVALFWNSGGALGLPVQKVRSVFAGGSATDISSNIYRASENLNLWHTVRENPFGTGFGKPFDKVFAMSDISQVMPNWDYDPHNMIFGLWMELGSVGFAVFLFFFAGLLVSASFSIRHANDPVIKSAAVFCTTALTSALLASTLDQFIWAQRGALFLGTMMGLGAAIGAIQGRSVTFAGQRHASRPPPSE